MTSRDSHASAATSLPLGSWVSIGACVGLVTGLVEVGVALWSAVKPQEPWPGLILFNPHRLWLKPVVDACLFSCVALIAGAVHQLLPGPATKRAGFWLLAVTAFIAILLPYAGLLTTRTVVILALGAAVPASAALHATHGRWSLRLLRRAMAGALVVFVILGVVRLLRPRLAERQAVSALTPAAGATPNVILVVLDTARALDFATPRAEAPNFMRLADRGVVFDRAFATSSWTLETHASLFTGLYPHDVFSSGQTPLNANAPMPGGMPTLSEVLGARGYRTGGFAANHAYGTRAHGLDRGFQHYEDYALNLDAVLSSPAIGEKAMDMYGWWKRRPIRRDHLDAGHISQAFLEWFDGRGDRPAFAFLNLMDAHDPYVPPEEFRRPGERRPGNPYLNVVRRYGAPETAVLREAYDACLRYLDSVVGALARGLEARGVLDDTILVVTSDHGEHFGEHGLISHGNSLYRATLQVPLLIRYPRATPGAGRVATPVSVRDVPATILDLAGVPGAPLPGASLASSWRGGEARLSPVLSTLVIGREKHRWAPEWWPVSRGAMRSIVAEGHHYVRNGDGVEELYDLEGDPGEETDLSKDPGKSDLMQRLRADIARLEPGAGARVAAR